MGPEDQAIERDRWAAIVAAEARGEPIDSESAEARRRFEEAHPEVVREEAFLWASIGALGQRKEPTTEMSDAALMDRVLAEVGSRGEALAGGESQRPPAKVIAIGRARTRRGVAGLFAAVALAAALAALAAEILTGGAISSTLLGDAPEAGSAAPSGPSARGQNGEAIEAPPVPTATPVESPSNTADLKPTGPVPAPAPDVAPSEKAGEVAPKEAHSPAGSGVAAAPEPPRDTADRLLQSAQARLGEGKTQEAVAAYKELLSRFPGSPEARAALVSLGRLSLGGSPAEALGYFDQYLSGGGGPLSVEARYGRIQALRRLGRAADERAAITEFLARHGDSVYAPRLRERLE